MDDSGAQTDDGVTAPWTPRGFARVFAVATCARPPLSTRNRIGQDNPAVRLARV